MFFLSCVCYAFVCVCLFVSCVTCWEMADLLTRVCHFPIGILGLVWYLIVSIPDLCTLTYFYNCIIIQISLHNIRRVGLFTIFSFKVYNSYNAFHRNRKFYKLVFLIIADLQSK